MRLRDHCPQNARRLQCGVTAGFTLVEALVAIGISMLVLTGAMQFLYYSAKAVSGVVAQTVISQQAGNTIEFIQSRVRFATFISNSVSGNVLTLGFDDNYTNDSDGDLIAYNDRDHYEQFQFIGVNSTNSTACASNKLVYYANTASTTNRTLIPTGVRNLPGYNIFSMTNKVITIIRFGIVDGSTLDNYQAIDVQATAVSLNRLWNTNIMAIYPNH